MFAEDEQDSFLLAHVQHCDTTVPAQLAMHILCKALLSPWIYISSFALEDPAKKWDQDNSDNQTWPVDKYQKCCAGQNPSNTEGWGIPGVGWTWRTRGDSDSTKWHKNNDPPPQVNKKMVPNPRKIWDQNLSLLQSGTYLQTLHPTYFNSRWHEVLWQRQTLQKCYYAFLVKG